MEYIADEILLMKGGQKMQAGKLEPMVAGIRGKVWECCVRPEETEKYQAQFSVSNLRNTNEGVRLRIVADQCPTGDAKRVSVMSGLVVIISLSPTFSEDYAFRTADILLPTVNGRFYLWKARLLAGCCFATIYYWLLGTLLFVDLWVLYGLDGLWVSGHFIGQYLFMDLGAALWKEVVILYLGRGFSYIVIRTDWSAFARTQQLFL